MSHAFIRIVAREDSVICINAHQLVSFHIQSQATCREVPNDLNSKTYKADVLRLYFNGGTALRYEVGKDITHEEFVFTCSLLHEWLHRSVAEIEALEKQKAQRDLELWNAGLDKAEEPVRPEDVLADERVSDNTEV